MNWMVWIQSRDGNGAGSYIYPFNHVQGATAEEAVDFVLNRYCATRDGLRFLDDPQSRLTSAWAAPREHVTEVQLQAIDQPQYERVDG